MAFFTIDIIKKEAILITVYQKQYTIIQKTFYGIGIDEISR